MWNLKRASEHLFAAEKLLAEKCMEDQRRLVAEVMKIVASVMQKIFHYEREKRHERT